MFHCLRCNSNNICVATLISFLISGIEYLIIYYILLNLYYDVFLLKYNCVI